jgi:ParB family transcriptional regulator, chromosome partitioning protein
MEVIEKRLEEIKPYEKNPRKNEDAVQYVSASIQEFGFKVPIVIDRNGVIVAGHTRYKAAQQLGMESVPCVVADDLSDEQIKAFRLADNKTAEMAGWDFEMLDIELADILDIDMGEFGFDGAEEPNAEEIESEDEKTGRVIVSINIPSVAEWNLIEDEIKRIASEINATVAVKLE